MKKAPKTKIKTPKPPNNFFRVVSFFGPLKWRIFWVTVVGSISIVAYAFMPGFLKSTFDSLRASVNAFEDPNVAYVVKMLIVYGALALGNGIFDVICIYLILNYENVIIEKKLIDIKHKLDVAPASFLEKFATGDLTRRMANMTADITKTVLATVYTIARVTVFFITTSIMMFYINWILAIVVILSLPVCILTARFVSKRTQKHFNTNGAISSLTYSYVDQKLSLRAFYNMHGLDGDCSDFEDVNNKQTKTMIAEDTATAFNTVYITFIQNLWYLLVTAIFALLFVTGSLTAFGALPAFLVYSNRFLSYAVVVTTATNLVQGINSKSGRVFEILDCPEDVTENEHIKIARIQGDIVFKNVTLIKNDEKQLDRVSFIIPTGKNVAFVGPTGCGKSRIVELLAKLDIQTDGTITLDGINASEITNKSYYKRMGLASEKPFIFRGTIAENLLYGIRRALPENVMEVTKLLGSNVFIEQLPQGYETLLTENTTVLSDSQKQAINVARTVLQSPDLAIFNEAMSSADTVTEKTVYEKIMKMIPKRTTIFITHRLTSIEKCDIIFYMENGSIVEMGTHAELLANKKQYYRAFTAE